MSEKPQHLRLPRGIDDIDPDRAATHIRLQSHWFEVCRSHGYQPIVLPPVGFAATFSEGHHAGRGRTYEFADRRNRTLALASDSLPGALRLAATRDLHRQRLAYAAPIFRYERRPRRHFHHLGILDLARVPSLDDDRTTLRQLDVIGDFITPLVETVVTVADPGVWQTALGTPSTDVLNALRRTAPEDRPALLTSLDANAAAVRLAEHLVEEASARDAATWTDLPDSARRRIDRVVALAAEARKRGMPSVVDLAVLHASEFHDAPSFTIRPSGESRLLGDGGDYTSFARRFLNRPASAHAAMVGLERLADLTGISKAPAADVMVLSLLPETLEAAEDLADVFRRGGLTVWLDHADQAIPTHLRDADYLGIDHVILIGAEESVTGILRIRDSHGTLHEVQKDDAVTWLRARVHAPAQDPR